MKKYMRFWILWVIVCLLLTGCRSSGALLPTETIPTRTEEIETTDGATEPTEEEEDMKGNQMFTNVQTKRIPYTGLRSSVVYVTDPAQLPQDDAFAGYDADFFRTRALVLVTDTVGSGSIRVGIEDIVIRGNVANVYVSREMPGDVGTCDMATWYIWAEVETGLTCRWAVANPVYNSAANKLVSKW